MLANPNIQQCADTRVMLANTNIQQCADNFVITANTSMHRCASVSRELCDNCFHQHTTVRRQLGNRRGRQMVLLGRTTLQITKNINKRRSDRRLCEWWTYQSGLAEQNKVHLSISPSQGYRRHYPEGPSKVFVLRADEPRFHMHSLHLISY